ncbi:MAG: methionyl-tRNA formyltransferase [Verrucomicrobia bacterium]|nr:methionyl-tRNA formyltransferase [Verrucomicrobiota bacterium]MDA1065485.1 methionyl-tRNA formyltransferase [Verrucomicrobiota bacterium]
MSHLPPVRLVFMGSDPIVLPTLGYVLSRNDLVEMVAVYTQPDRARGRGQKVQPNEVKTWAMEHSIPVVQPESFGEEEIADLEKWKAGIILVMAYGHLLPQKVLDSAALGIYNIHTSLLPALRGASPIETAVASGVAESGVTLMQLVMKMDAGPICGQLSVPKDDLETGGSYRKKLANASPGLLKVHLPSIVEGSIGPQKQNESAVTYCRLLVKQDGQLDFNHPARDLAQRINGLNPWPGCFAELNEVILKVGTASWSDENCSQEPGVILKCDQSGVSVSTVDGVLNLLTLQKPGGRMLPADDFLRGFPIQPGSRFVSHSMHPLVTKKPVSHKRVFQLYAKP